MSKVYDPPINSKTTTELLEIIEYGSNWEEEALNQAKEELIKRGYSIEDQIKYKTRKENYKRRVSKVKSDAKMTKWDSILYILLLPIRLILKDIPFLDAIESKNAGYNKIWKQKLILASIGVLFWLGVLYLYLMFEFFE